MHKTLFLFLFPLAAFGACGLPRSVLELPPSAENCRNSEGDTALLADGSMIYIYSHYLKGTGGDHDHAVLNQRVSPDGGRTWGLQETTVVQQEGTMNVMSVSLLRLQDKRLALVYAVKNSESDCRAAIRFSSDEGRTWSGRTMVVPDSRIGYYVNNNARLVQLKSGRLILPLSYHASKDGKIADWHGQLCCSYSDDGGATWTVTQPFPTVYNGQRVTTQEPGVIELKDGRLLMWARTKNGMQFRTFSSDGGATWCEAKPWNLMSPCSPATIRRLRNGDLVAIWNNHARHPEYKTGDGQDGKRTPLTIAYSKNEGETWINAKDFETDPAGWFCYISCEEVRDRLVVSYCAKNNLQHSRITVIPTRWIYK